MTRGRQANTAHVVTGQTAPPGHRPCQQAAPEAVLASVMQRDAGDLSATEQIRQAQEQSGGAGHLLTLWSAAVKQTLYPDLDRQIKAQLTGSEAWRYDREHARTALQQRLRAAQLAGHDTGALIGQITAAPMDRARSISSVLHGRLQRLTLPQLAGHDLTWAQRTPASAPAVARDLAAALDDRIRALGEHLAVSPEPWLARHLGVIASGASPALRAEYTRRAGLAAAYREAAGITDPGQAVAPQPHRGSPELETMRKAVFTALEIRDEADIIRGLHRGELESRVLAGERAQASAPPDVTGTLRLTARAEADAFPQSADAEAQHDNTGAASARSLAGRLAAGRQRLEVGHARYEHWAAGTHATREAAGKARAELQRRGQAQPGGAPQPQPDGEPQTTARWGREPGADCEAAGRAIARQHQAATGAGQAWPPHHAPELTPNPNPAAEPASAQPRQDNRAARLDQPLALAGDTARRLTAQRAGRQASSEYAARLERQAQAEPGAGHQAEEGFEIEM